MVETLSTKRFIEIIRRMLILFTDDQRSDTLSALGNSETHRPNMNKLVRQGKTSAIQAIDLLQKRALSVPRNVRLQ